MWRPVLQHVCCFFVFIWDIFRIDVVGHAADRINQFQCCFFEFLWMQRLVIIQKCYNMNATELEREEKKGREKRAARSGRAEGEERGRDERINTR